MSKFINDKEFIPDHLKVNLAKGEADLILATQELSKMVKRLSKCVGKESYLKDIKDGVYTVDEQVGMVCANICKLEKTLKLIEYMKDEIDTQLLWYRG